jgi:hypothetical protein
MIQSGLINKTAAGELEIKFPTTFSATPRVVVAPYWGSRVGYVETIVNVSESQCTITSQNAGSNYYVSWIAVTP